MHHQPLPQQCKFCSCYSICHGFCSQVPRISKSLIFLGKDLPITCVFICFLRLERVHIARRDGLAKTAGAIASVGGATTITLFKGLPLQPKKKRPSSFAPEADTRQHSRKRGRGRGNCRIGHGVVYTCLDTAYDGLVGWFFR